MGDEPIVYRDQDGIIVYRASALGGCLQALLAARLEYEAAPVPPRMQKVFDAGHDAEDVAIEWLEAHGYLVIDREMPVRLAISRSIHVAGHIDGHFCMGHRSVAVCEIKSQSQDEWDAYNRGRPSSLWVEKYPWQFAAYEAATGLPLWLVRVNRETGEVTAPKLIDERPPLNQIRQRVLQVEAAAAKGVLSLPCDNSYPCPYYYLHEEPERELIADAAVDVLARQYKAGKRIEAVGAEKARVARWKLREYIANLHTSEPDDGAGAKYVTEAGNKVTFFVKGRASELHESRPDDPFKLVNEWEEVRVTLAKEEGEANGS